MTPEPRAWSVEAVLFDLDGTLIDSSAAVERSWRQLAAMIDRPWAEVAPHIHGVPVPQVMAQLYPSMPAARIEELRQFMVDAESTDVDGVVAQPGAVAALAVLPPDRVAIVTSGGRRLAASRIAAAGLPTPAVVVTADDLAVGKPDPAPYLTGAAKLAVAPQDCLVVEDAPAGVASARAAGCSVIGVLTTHDRLDAPSVASLDRIRFAVDAGRIHVTLLDEPAN